jgi:hypothetical protein
MEGLAIGEQLQWLTVQQEPGQSRSTPPTAVNDLSSPEVDPDVWLKKGLEGLEVDQEIRRPIEEALRFADLSPEASIGSARAALIAIVKKTETRDVPNFLDQAIRDHEDGGQISENNCLPNVSDPKNSECRRVSESKSDDSRCPKRVPSVR